MKSFGLDLAPPFTMLPRSALAILSVFILFSAFTQVAAQDPGTASLLDDQSAVLPFAPQTPALADDVNGNFSIVDTRLFQTDLEGKIYDIALYSFDPFANQYIFDPINGIFKFWSVDKIDTLLSEVFPGEGVLGRRKPSSKEMEEVEFGFPIAKKLADLEIGQTIVVKNKTVVAVEAIEGTDKALERGCKLSRGKCIALKVSRTNQDYRYDVPGIGPQTLEGLINGGASVLALEAGRVMVVDQSRLVKMADQAKMSIVCI